MTLKLFEPTLGEVPAKLRHLYRLDAAGGYRLGSPRHGGRSRPLHNN
jgi:hypothetical protein